MSLKIDILTKIILEYPGNFGKRSFKLLIIYIDKEFLSEIIILRKYLKTAILPRVLSDFLGEVHLTSFFKRSKDEIQVYIIYENFNNINFGSLLQL